MLITVGEFRDAVHGDVRGLVQRLQGLTGRDGAEEAHAWQSSLPRLADALGTPALAPIHLYFAGAGYLALEYQLPGVASWCDVVLLGRHDAGASAIVVELKDWTTGGDQPGPYEGLMERGSSVVLHPSDQVRGYVEFCRRFHSAVQDQRASVRGCVLFTREYFARRYAEPPNDRLVAEYPCFTMAPIVVREALPAYLLAGLNTPDADFARAFVTGRYRQDRGFIRQIGAQILDPSDSPFELLDHQRRAFAWIQATIRKNVLGAGTPRKQVILIEGPPGSGKSVLAARVWAELVTDADLPPGSAVLTTTSTSQTSNWARMFERAGRSKGARGVVRTAASYTPISTIAFGKLRKLHGMEFAADPVAWRENVQLLRDWGVPFQDGAGDEQHLVSVVDEAHALINPEHPEGRGQFGFAPNFGPQAWNIMRSSTVTVFLLDPRQGFRDRENTTVDDIRRWAKELGAAITEPISLSGAQFRCAGSTEFVDWVDATLSGDVTRASRLAEVWRRVLDFRMAESPAALEAELREHQRNGRSVRLLAGYARPWKTRGAAKPHRLPPAQQDFYERYVLNGATQHWSRIWNFVPRGNDYTWFIQAPEGSPMHADPLCEVGCPYAVRGFDFDYVGVLWLSDLIRRGANWQVDVKHVHESGLDRSLATARRSGGAGAPMDQLRDSLAQAYRILLTRGIHGCYLWCEDKETKEFVGACLG